MARRYFGTDGVRGVVGEFLTPELVERLGRAAALWTGAAKVFVGRDTRASGVELEEAFARGVISAGGDCILGGVLPTPAVALLALDLGVVISASHNPPEYNGVKFFDGEGRKLSDRSEEQIEAAARGGARHRPGAHRARRSRDRLVPAAHRRAVRLRPQRPPHRRRLRQRRVLGARTERFHALRRRGALDRRAPDGANINVGCGATDLALLQQTVRDGGYDLGIAFDGDGDRMLAVDENGEAVDGDQIIAILALDLEVDKVAVTVMTNLGFHALMRERGIEVLTTAVGDRYVLEALQEAGAVLGGEQSGHVIYLRDHVTGDGLAAGLLLCAALKGRRLSEVASVMHRYPQVKENVRVERGELTPAIEQEVERRNAEWGDEGRVLVRPSGTEPLIRVLAEARDAGAAEEACASISTLVRQQLG